MFDYLALRSLAFEDVLDGQCLSQPVPRMEGDSALDCYFVYSMDREADVPNEPVGCFGVDLEGETYVGLDARELFSGISFDPGKPAQIEGYVELLDEAEGLYGDVRDEVFSGASGEAARRYVALLEEMTPSCLMPYYRALAPALFGVALELG